MLTSSFNDFELRVPAAISAIGQVCACSGVCWCICSGGIMWLTASCCITCQGGQLSVYVTHFSAKCTLRDLQLCPDAIEVILYTTNHSQPTGEPVV